MGQVDCKPECYCAGTDAEDKRTVSEPARHTDHFLSEVVEALPACVKNDVQANPNEYSRLINLANSQHSSPGVLYQRTFSKDSNDYLQWRLEALPAPPELAHRMNQVKVNPMLLAKRINETLDEVKDYLLNPEKHKTVCPDITPLIPPDSDWSGLMGYLLMKVRSVNALPGPRMRLVWWKTLDKLGRLPRWPQDAAHILDAEELLVKWHSKMDGKGKIDGRTLCISFFSHRWERPSMNPKDAHPDTTDNRKAKCMREYGCNEHCPIFEHHKVEYYYWIDFACIDQDGILDKALGICKLPAYVQSCLEAIYYISSTTDYEPQASTRVERMIAYTLTVSPLLKYMDDKYPADPGNVDALADKHPNVYSRNKSGMLMMKLKDPLGKDAQLTDDGDRDLIKSLVHICMTSIPMNPVLKAVVAADHPNDAEARAGSHIKFDETLVPIDNEHYKIDAKAFEQRRMLTKRMTATRFKGRLAEADRSLV